MTQHLAAIVVECL